MAREEKKKICFYCKEKKEPDFLEYEILTKFLSERGRMLGRSKTGFCGKHQRRYMKEVKKARQVALVPFIVRPE